MQTAAYHKQQRRKKRRQSLSWLLLLILIIGYPAYTLQRPLPLLRPALASAQLSADTPEGSLPWPASGQSALAIKQLNVSTTHGNQTPVPTASTAKVLTALCVLSKKPLQPGQQGPTITLSQADANLYNQYVAQDGSVLLVNSGEQITEYQMLEAMLLPSANNIADSLAIWAFGSMDTYHTFANHYAKQLGMTNTTVATDASGFSPNTTSTAADLVKLGQAAMENPVLAGMVSQSSAVIPQNGTIYNVNALLGTDNIVGIKTGNTDQAGGVFIGAANVTISGKELTIVTAVAGAPTLGQALSSSAALLKAAQSNFTSATIIKAGAVVGDYKAPWSDTILPATVQRDLTVYSWRGSTIPATIKLQPLTATGAKGQIVGTITSGATSLAGAQSVPVTVTGNTAHAPIKWRLLHPF